MYERAADGAEGGGALMIWYSGMEASFGLPGGGTDVKQRKPMCNCHFVAVAERKLLAFQDPFLKFKFHQ